MKTRLRTALAAAATLFVFSNPASADSIGLYSPETVGAAALGSSEMIVHIPVQGQRAQTVDAIDVTGQQLVNVYPGDGQTIDMSGRDGSLRSCYTNGGIARQGQDLTYRCEYEDTSVRTVESSPYITPQGVDTGYNGTSSVEDPALVDCVSRGGTLIQLAGNQQFACAM